MRLQRGQWSRLVWSGLLHLDEWHLYYNMSSFLWKGLQLEPAYGPVGFAALILELLFSCQAIYLGAFWAARAVLGPNSAAALRMYSHTCVAGFSGVLFGLKAVLTSSSLAWQHVNVPGFGRIQMPPKVCSTALMLATASRCACTPRACSYESTRCSCTP